MVDTCAAELDADGFVIRVIAIPDDQAGRAQEFCAVDLDLGGTWRLTKTDRSVDGAYAGPEMKWQPAKGKYTSPRPYKSWRQVGDDWDPPIGKERPADLPDSDWDWNERTGEWESVPTTLETKV
jgi:hypothetical protein